MRYWFAVSLVCLVASSAMAQQKEYNWKTNLQLGDKLYSRGSYFNAIDYYEKVLKEKPDNIDLLWKVAETERNLRDYADALESYKKVLDIDGNKYPAARFYYALMLKMTGDCGQASIEFDNYTIKTKNPDPILQQQAQLEKQGCDLNKTVAVNNETKIRHLDGKVNSKGVDFAPFPLSATDLVYSSIRTDSVIVMDSATFFNKAALSRLYLVKQNGDTWSDPVMLPDFINGDLSATNGAFSPDRSLFFFSECTYNRSLKVHCDLYLSKYNNGQFEQPTKLPPQINGAGYTSTQPTVADEGDGKFLLYYSSDRPEGKGGRDIWVSAFDDNLAFQKPENVSAVNTASDDITPFFNQETGTLYYSTNGLPSLGGFDIYYTSQDGKGNWSSPTNLGKPFNGSTDDMYFVLNTDQQVGYLASNRPGTMSLRSETTSEDIYAFKLKKVVKYQAAAYQLGDTTKTPIEGVKLVLYKKDAKTGKYEQLADSNVVNKGKYFDLKLKGGNEYKLVASKDKYLSDTKIITAQDLENANGLQDLSFNLDKINKDKTYRLANIYYDYNSATLRDSSKTVLDTLFSLLAANPKIVIELSSHTDSRGSSDYNLKLSQARADSCVAYLIAKGISANRLVAKGYGEDKPLNKCVDGVTCTEEEYQVNRRTEFKVIGELEEGQIIEQ